MNSQRPCAVADMFPIQQFSAAHSAGTPIGSVFVSTARPQPILTPLTPAAIFIVATIDEGGEERVHDALADLSGLVRAYGLDIRVLRPVNIVGTRQNTEKLLPRFLEMAAIGQPLPVHGEGAQVRAFAQIIGCDTHPLHNLRVLKFVKAEYGQDQEGLDAWCRHWIGAGLAAGVGMGQVMMDALRGSPAPAAGSAPVASAPAPTADDPEARLAKLKALLDKGLVTQADYDSAKAEIIKKLIG